MSFSHILFEPGDDGIVQVTINRPKKLNALNRETMDELSEAFHRVAETGSARGLLLTGAGDRAFVAGADITEFDQISLENAHSLTRKGQQILRRLETMRKPSVAAIQGFALGGGCELALACTMRVASEDAQLGQPEVKLGIIAGYGGTQRLPRLVGPAKALEMLLTGDPVDAAEALRIGLVNHVVPRERLLEFSRGLLRKAIAGAPLAMALTMEAVDTGLSCGLEEGLRFEAAAFALAAMTEDKAEGVRAFLEKRPPVFFGK